MWGTIHWSPSQVSLPVDMHSMVPSQTPHTRWGSTSCTSEFHLAFQPYCTGRWVQFPLHGLLKYLHTYTENRNFCLRLISLLQKWQMSAGLHNSRQDTVRNTKLYAVSHSDELMVLTRQTEMLRTWWTSVIQVSINTVNKYLKPQTKSF